MLDTQLNTFREIKDTLPEKCRRVLKVITGAIEGLTLFEIQDRLSWPVNRVSGRITELRKAGKIVDSGFRRINPESGKKAVVWVTVYKDRLF